MVYTGSQDGSEKIESPIDTSQDGEVKDHARDMPREPRIGFLLAVLVLIIVTAVSLYPCVHIVRLTVLQATSVTADWLVDSMDGISSRVSKEWVGLILLPAVTSLA
ncbi:hypothetical protein C0993_008262, partial [Termitomyces sp. T159_Od127]